MKKLTKKDELMRETVLLIVQLPQASGIKTIDGIYQLTAMLMKQALEGILEVEQEKELDYKKYQYQEKTGQNSRNGYRGRR
ncbi:MAG: transposase [Christensenellaceae bacterium]|jgi:transposase-like protein|nr:transposase [Christensenellaceae bacterium]